jgi:hypothetical protein
VKPVRPALRCPAAPLLPLHSTNIAGKSWPRDVIAPTIHGAMLWRHCSRPCRASSHVCWAVGPGRPEKTLPSLPREHEAAVDVKRLKGEAALEHEHEHLLTLLSSSSSEGSSRFNVRLPRHEAYPGSLQRFRHFRRAGKNAPAGVERHRPICVLITIPAAFQAPDLAGRSRIIQL